MWMWIVLKKSETELNWIESKLKFNEIKWMNEKKERKKNVNWNEMNRNEWMNGWLDGSERKRKKRLWIVSLNNNYKSNIEFLYWYGGEGEKAKNKNDKLKPNLLVFFFWKNFIRRKILVINDKDIFFELFLQHFFSVEIVSFLNGLYQKKKTWTLNTHYTK